ncbi:M56 family metallopeptidase [Sphingomonas sp.]|uniref:M56 family metallopeptidase n=1 Tax=Sphingomonas sp. TaxID=28214 RepID=UPI00286E92D0|nr:M56 family metallopeptidase [Sphingomonas sp.]
MEFVVALALKSLLIAGGALLLLKMTERRRSAADRSLIAHLGLLAVLLLPAAALALPALEVAGPAFLAEPAADVPASAAAPEVAAASATFPGAEIAPQAVAAAPALDWQLVAYAVPAAVLLLLTLIALLRLVPLKARASVLVDPHWLSALAHAQRRMGFKNGTALLTSDELKSPISWGLLRPTILLNAAATEAHDEAEAIIAHELAHVGNFDWAKLLLARVAVALFWFNPLVWLLAREAHQLREEAADDAVLAADIEDTHYASLLVGIARHECNGLLIGAHGVAPGRGSLARRVRRVLDAASQRAPGGWRWTSAAAFFAAGMAVPVAALSVVAPSTPPDALSDRLATAPAPRDPQAPTPLTPATPATEVAALHPHDAEIDRAVDTAEDARDTDVDIDIDHDVDSDRDDGPVIVRVNPDWNPAADITAAVARATAGLPGNPFGITPAYAAAIRASAPSLRSVTTEQLTSFRVHGVTPGYIRELHGLGISGLTADQLTNAAVHEVSVSYARGIAAAGLRRTTLADLVQMRIFDVSPSYAARLRRSRGNLSPSELIQAKIHGERDDP